MAITFLNNKNPANKAKNLLPQNTKDTVERGGITVAVNKGSYTFSGTATATFFEVVDGGVAVIPDWIIPGKSYYIDYTAAVTWFRMYCYDTAGNGKKIVDTRESIMFTVPEDIAGVQFRLQIYNGDTVDETVTPYISEVLFNEPAFAPPEPMLTIIDDDGDIGFYNDILPIIESKNVSIASAVTTTRIGSANRWMTWEQILDCYSRGAEILCHTYDHTHDGDDVITEIIEHKYTKARNEMLKRGLAGGNILVYSYSVFDKAKTAAEKTFRCAFNSAGSRINTISNIDPYQIARYNPAAENYMYEIDKLKALVDLLASQQSGWMVWMVHTSEAAWTDYNAAQVISNIIDYARECGVCVASAEHGYKKYVLENPLLKRK